MGWRAVHDVSDHAFEPHDSNVAVSLENVLYRNFPCMVALAVIETPVPEVLETQN